MEGKCRRSKETVFRLVKIMGALIACHLLPLASCRYSNVHPLSRTQPLLATIVHTNKPLAMGGCGGECLLRGDTRKHTLTPHIPTHLPTQPHTLRLRGGGRILRFLYRTYRRNTSDLPRSAVDVLLRWGVTEDQLPNDVRQAVFSLHLLFMSVHFYVFRD
jgi:hypothetical protein